VLTMRLSFQPGGVQLAGSGTQETKIWDTATGQLIRAWSPGGSVTYSPDGRLLAAGTDKEAIFCDAATGSEVKKFAKSKGRLTFSGWRSCIVLAIMAGAGDDRTPLGSRPAIPPGAGQGIAMARRAQGYLEHGIEQLLDQRRLARFSGTLS